MKFKIGDKVVLLTTLSSNRHDIYVNEVISFIDDNIIVRDYGIYYNNGNLYERSYKPEQGSKHWSRDLFQYKEDQLVSLDMAKIMLHELNEAASFLNEEFEKAKPAIVEKLSKMGSLAQETADELIKYNKSFDDVVLEAEELYRSINRAGWRHSTFKCRFGD